MPAAEQRSIYIYIGQRIRERRKLLKLSQSQLAAMMGFSYQQMQKYEAGTSEASVGKLLQFAKILHVPPPYFYEGAMINDHIGTEISNDIIEDVRTEPLKVLLVEHNPADVILFRKALSACSEQADLHVLHDAGTVGDYLRNHRAKYGKPLPDILITDMNLPKISGVQLLKSIKQNMETTTLPVIIMTHSISKKEMREAYRCGAAGFIRKSMDMGQYMDSIEMTLRYWSKAVSLPTMS